MTNRRKILLTSACAGLVGMCARSAKAQLEVDIDRGRIEPLPVAVSDFAGDNPQAREIAARIVEIIAADLNGSGLFETIDRNAHLEGSADMQPFPNFASWRLINAQAMVSGRVTAQPGQQIDVEYRLWDVLSEQQLRAQRLQADASSLRRIAHKIADAVYERMIGERGYFDTRVVYVTETGPMTNRTKNLSIIDQDGANERPLTSGNNLLLSPNMSPDGKTVAFIAFHRGRLPQIFTKDLRTGVENVLFSGAQGMTFSPRYAPDGRSMLFSVANEGNTEIFTFDFASGRTTRLTSHPAIDTSPTYSPDGSRIAFNSDRGGSAQLYMMNRDGSNVRRFSFGAGRYGSPAWSPRGDFIAFTKIKDSMFHIGVMRPDGSDERLITRSFFDEQPSWAPNGRTIVFTRQDPQTDRSRLFTIDLTGYNLRELRTSGDASDADWADAVA